jgi:hypothetical protein
LKLLGKLKDPEVARRTGRTQSAVIWRRRCLGISHAPLAHRPWTKAEEKLLTLPDCVSAPLLNLPKWIVVARRRKLGIPGINPRVREWTPMEDKILANHSIEAAARRLGRTLSSVLGRRVKLGIKRSDPAHRRWPKGEEALLGTMSDELLAKRLKRTVNAVQLRRRQLDVRMFGTWRAAREGEQGWAKGKGSSTLRPTKGWRHWTANEDKLLGRYSNAEAARRLGRSLDSVSLRRSRMGISSPPAQGLWTKKEEALLGTMTDRELARVLGRTELAVVSRRAKLGISKYGGGGMES